MSARNILDYKKALDCHRNVLINIETMFLCDSLAACRIQSVAQWLLFIIINVPIISSFWHAHVEHISAQFDGYSGPNLHAVGEEVYHFVNRESN